MKIDLIVCLAAALILLFCILVLLRINGILKQNYEMIQDSCRNLEELNRRLRVQRHDYLNHLQVVYGLMELGEYEELHDYLEPVYRDIMKTAKAIRTACPAVNALFAAKMAEAESRGIDFYIEVKSDLKHLNMEAWELCKVLSNLIDNAITACENLSGSRTIRIDVNEDKEHYVISVANNGPAIPEEIRSMMFRPGVTTKRQEGHGMGLYIAEKVLRQNGGTISAVSEPDETVFTVYLEKEGK